MLLQFDFLQIYNRLAMKPIVVKQVYNKSTTRSIEKDKKDKEQFKKKHKTAIKQK